MAVVVKSVFTSPVTLSGYGQATDGQAVLGAGVKLQEAARRRENHAGWYGWNMHREELYGRLSREHAATAEGLMEETDERMSA